MTQDSAGAPSRALRIGVAAAASLLLAWYCAHDASLEDFVYALRAAQRILDGRDAYLHGEQLAHEPNGIFLYPLPAALLAMPFAALPRQIAGAAFFALSTAFLTYGLTRRN